MISKLLTPAAFLVLAVGAALFAGLHPGARPTAAHRSVVSPEPAAERTAPPPRTTAPASPVPPLPASAWRAIPAADGLEPGREGTASTRAGALQGSASPADSRPDTRVFGEFREWLRRRREAAGGPGAGPGMPGELESEGLALAHRRRDALLALIRTDPRRALAMALSERERAELPAAIGALLEEPVSGQGDLEVLCALPEPGREDGWSPLRRYVAFPDRRYAAFVYGRREDTPSRRGLSLHGIAVGSSLAVAESPLQRREPADAGTVPAAAADGACALGENHSVEGGEGGPVVAEAFGRELHFCSERHAERYEEELIAGEETGTDPAATRQPLATASTPTLKTLLFIRVDFSDLPGESITSLRAASLARELDQFYRDNSYSRAGFRTIGTGSDVTPLFRMPRTAAYYGSNEDYAATLRTDARAAARTAGYALADFEYDVVCLGSVPGYGWAGLGYVGQPGAWIRGTTSTGVTAHELGHNLGLYHANFWDTGGRSVTGAGQSIEYGDSFDTMGAANAGAYHFNARYKRQLGWLGAGEYTVATTNGLYRILAHDQPEPAAGSRGLQVFVNARTNYWVEFRQRFTGKPALMNGAGLRWARRDNGPSLLLDTTPGSTGEKDDSPIAMGRTYSDFGTGIHLTPVARGGTNPTWLDVMVNRGTFPSNHGPDLILETPASQGTTDTVLQFHARATDPDGDALAYYWEFGDSAPSTNTASIAHRWTASGDYLVRCTATDTRGGLARRSVAIRIGLPSTFRLRGRVTADGEPAGGVRVSAGSGRTTLTDSDGTYILPGIARGTVTLSAADADRQFAAVSFTNPLSVTADREGLHFAAVEVATRAPVTLVTAGSVWKYWDQGTLIGTGWRSRDFNDSAWNSGPAILGYGGDRETTVIGYGPDSSRKYLTAWFRRKFVVDDPGRLSAVLLGLLRDDGAAVYLNGQELLRDNLPTGALTSQTAASSTVSGTEEQQFFEFDVSPSRLVAGTNILAVEVHQSSQSSSDTAFDLRLTADLEQSVAPGVQLVRPASGLELTAPARIVFAATLGDLPGHAGARVVRVEFLADGQAVATAASAPYAGVWTVAPPGDHELKAVALLDDGARLESPLVQVHVRNPALTPVLIPAGSIWRYLDTGVAPATAWTQRDFDDSGWLSGPARLGYGEDGEFTVVRFGSDPARRPITTWFRRRFELSAASTIESLLLRLQRDDGAVVYLNGQEVYRTGLRTGSVTPTLVALADITNDAEQVWLDRSLAPGGLVDGMNVVAVEMHQASASNTDLGFDLELHATRSSIPVEPAPELAWRYANGQLVLQWPASAGGWRLESARALAGPGSWTLVPGTPMTAGDRLELPVSPDPLAGNAFYRLTRPAGP